EVFIQETTAANLTDTGFAAATDTTALREDGTALKSVPLNNRTRKVTMNGGGAPGSNPFHGWPDGAQLATGPNGPWSRLYTFTANAKATRSNGVVTVTSDIPHAFGTNPTATNNYTGEVIQLTVGEPGFAPGRKVVASAPSTDVFTYLES